MPDKAKKWYIRPSIMGPIIIAVGTIIAAVIGIIPPPSGITVQGTVTQDGVPVLNAEVCIDGIKKDITTPPDGKYIIKGIKEGLHILTVRKDGVFICKETISVKKEADNVMSYYIIIPISTPTPTATPIPTPIPTPSPTPTPSTIPTVMVHIFEISTNVGSFYTLGESYAYESLVNDPERGEVMKLVYDVKNMGAFCGLYAKLDGFDISEYRNLNIAVKGDKTEGFPTEFKIELKTSGNRKVGEHKISGITTSWQEFGFPIKENLGGIDEITIVFTHDRVGADKDGVIYIHDLFLSAEGE